LQLPRTTVRSCRSKLQNHVFAYTLMKAFGSTAVHSPRYRKVRKQLVSIISNRSSNGPSTRGGGAISPTQSSPIKRAKFPALRLTMQRTGRASMGSPERVPLKFNVPRDRDGRGGNNYLSSLLSKSSCDCDDADIDMTYRMCCISVENSLSITCFVRQ